MRRKLKLKKTGCLPRPERAEWALIKGNQLVAFSWHVGRGDDWLGGYRYDDSAEGQPDAGGD